MNTFQFVVDQISRKRVGGDTLTLEKTSHEMNAACLTEKLTVNLTETRGFKVGGLVEVSIDPCIR